LQFYERWKKQASHCLRKLERDIVEQKEFSTEFFNQIKREIKSLACYDKELFLKIEAFDWIVHCSNLLNGQTSCDGGQTLNLLYWQNLFGQH
jgi:hypothetical protein